MNRCEFERLVTDTLNVVGDNPFSKYPSVTVFRHKGSKKWICAVMTIRRRLLGLNDDSYVDIVNFKCGNEILCLTGVKRTSLKPCIYGKTPRFSIASVKPLVILTSLFLVVC